MNSNRMFSTIRTAAVMAAAFALVGCAAGSAGMNTKSGRHGYQLDADYIVAVNRQAKRKGVNVVWVNPPQELGKEYLARGE